MHARRTAGNSFAAYFSNFAGDDDIIIESWREIIRHGGAWNKRAIWEALRVAASPSFYLPRRIKVVAKGIGSKSPVADFVTQLNFEAFRGRAKLGLSPSHASAADVARIFPREWNSYFRFSFVRNPFSFAVSDYLNKQPASLREKVSFISYLERLAYSDKADPEGILPIPKNNFEIYTIDSRIAVDFLGRFENLAGDIASICSRLGIPFDCERLPHAQNTGKGADWRAWYSDETVSLVKIAFKDELQVLGYKPPI